MKSPIDGTSSDLPLTTAAKATPQGSPDRALPERALPDRALDRALKDRGQHDGDSRNVHGRHDGLDGHSSGAHNGSNGHHGSDGHIGSDGHNGSVGHNGSNGRNGSAADGTDGHDHGVSLADSFDAQPSQHQILEALPAAVYTCDSKGRVTFFNKAASALWGRSPVLGKDLWCGSWRIIQLDGTALPLDGCPMAVALREGRAVRGTEIIIERPDGSRRNILPHPQPLFDARGNITGAINMLVDITSRKRDEQTLVRVNQELRQRNDEMVQFIYTVSHDLKSPLVTTMGFLGMIREDLSTGRQGTVEESLGHIERAVAHMSDLIEDLLDLSRIGRVELEVANLDVGAIAGELASDLAPRLEEAGATLEIEPQIPHVRADRARLVQVLDNLLSNAIKYGDRGGLKINVGGTVCDNEIRIFVQDNGKGIPSEYHKRIFELFQRLDARCEGTGVGLAIVSRVMQLHGGRAWVESMPGHGATFWLSFPRLDGS